VLGNKAHHENTFLEVISIEIAFFSPAIPSPWQYKESILSQPLVP